MIITLNDLINPSVGLVLTQQMINTNFNDVFVNMEGITPYNLRLGDLGMVIMRCSSLPFNLYTGQTNTHPGSLNSSKFFINFHNHIYSSRISIGDPLWNTNKQTVNRLSGCKIVLDLAGLLNIRRSTPYIVNSEAIYLTPIHSLMHYDSTGRGRIGHSNDNGDISWCDEDRVRYGLTGVFEFMLNDSVIDVNFFDEAFKKYTSKSKKKAPDPSKYIQTNDVVLYKDVEYTVTKVSCRNYTLHPKDFIYLKDSEGNEKIKYRSSCTLKTKFVKPKKEKKEVKIKQVTQSTPTSFTGGGNTITNAQDFVTGDIHPTQETIFHTPMDDVQFWNGIFTNTQINID